MSASTGSPALVLRRYFLSQMSTEAGCIGISRSAAVAVSMPSSMPDTASSRTVLIRTRSLYNACAAGAASLLCSVPPPLRLGPALRHQPQDVVATQAAKLAAGRQGVNRPEAFSALQRRLRGPARN